MSTVLIGGVFDTTIAEDNLTIIEETGAQVAPSLYSVVDAEEYDATINSIMEVEILDNPFVAGDEVIISFGSKKYSNVVNSVSGDLISLVDRLLAPSGSCRIKSPFNRCTLDPDLPAGEYYLSPTNEFLVVRASFNDPYITTGELSGQYKDASSTDYGMEILINKTALSRIYSDLRGIADVYDIVFFERIRQLKKQAMLMFLFPSNSELRESYYTLLEKTRVVKVKDQDTGAIKPASTASSNWGGF